MDIFDIAKLAGVSRKTVQRVLNKSPQVRPETRDRILKIIEEHQYHPNVSARRLVKKKTQTIGLFIIQDTTKHRIYSDDLFYSVVIGSMISACSDRGYNVLVTMADHKDSAAVMKLYREKSIDAGMIISWTNVQRIVDQIVSAGYIVGLFDQNNLSSPPPSIPIPFLQNEQGGKDAANYLIQLGHKEIAVITGDKDNHASIERLNGYKIALKEADIPVHPDFIFNGSFTEKSGSDAVVQWSQKEKFPSAIICFNDVIALGVIKAMRAAGLSVPDDVSVIGFDNVLLTEYTAPPLTTMHVPRVEMAASLVEQLICQIEEKPFDKSSIFKASLIERESCKPPK
ncbi:LacI family transcriptional regulator [Jeotgalibacillus sp. S-D1]|uniref:LacI family DNA-binding transcriptional regulator n=1 Tax=Jeotgalibacillus sp. S-D1 TaxID=2552189 RepID=UPI001059A112|nr:LacI family DNA-binding transcriptional regulator [Jeotgalibacillus sp. S-D1]TDL30849.1 LacI family transcriptional regulator [Jeotgalibacillus sp. S-D1]